MFANSSCKGQVLAPSSLFDVFFASSLALLGMQRRAIYGMRRTGLFFWECLGMIDVSVIIRRLRLVGHWSRFMKAADWMWIGASQSVFVFVIYLV